MEYEFTTSIDNLRPYELSELFGLNRLYLGSFKIEKVIFNDPVTVVIWADGTKTIVRCQEGDVFSKETGLTMAIVKKAYGNKGRYNSVLKKWCGQK